MRFPIPSYSHSGEDRLVWKLFGYRASGTYVDVGCYHSVDYSNTYLLYRAGWRGLVIDADRHFLGLSRRCVPKTRYAPAPSPAAGQGTLFTFPDRSLNTLDEAAAERWQKANPDARFERQPIDMRPLAACWKKPVSQRSTFGGLRHVPVPEGEGIRASFQVQLHLGVRAAVKFACTRV